jgi:FtsZ-binding cell division protein ZapB
MKREIGDLKEKQNNLGKENSIALEREQKEARNRKRRRTESAVFEKSKAFQNEISKVSKYTFQKFMEFLTPFGILIGPPMMTTKIGFGDLINNIGDM